MTTESDPDRPLHRWAERKAKVAQAEAAAAPATPLPAADATPPALTDADMPSLDSLTAESDYSPFFSPHVSAELRRLALRKLFHAPRFNSHDGLDDYGGDYTQFAPLGEVVTCDLRHQLDIAARHLLEQQEPDAATPEPAAPEPAAPTTESPA